MTEGGRRLIGGKYEVVEKLREGGMGAIYKVRHRFLEEIRVVKLLRPQLARDDKIQARFRNEAEVALKLRHPNIAHLHEFAVDEDGTPYIAMEYIDGVTLDELLDRSGVPDLDLAVEIGRQCLEALRYLHEQGFIHRDVAGDNLILTRGLEDRPLVKLIDLGIVKRLGAASDLTQTGTFMGKARYTAPEQFSGGGAAELDERADIYSFGVLFYELLTGKSPVSGKDFSEMLAGHLFQPPLDFAESDPEGRIPDGLRSLVLRALEKDPERRLASAAEFLEGLASSQAGEGGGSPAAGDPFKTTTSLKVDLPPPEPPSAHRPAPGETQRLSAAAEMVRKARERDAAQGPGLRAAADSDGPPAAPRLPGGRAAAWRWWALAGLAALAVLVLWLLLSR